MGLTLNNVIITHPMHHIYTAVAWPCSWVVLFEYFSVYRPSFCHTNNTTNTNIRNKCDHIDKSCLYQAIFSWLHWTSFLILVDQSTPHGLQSSFLDSKQPMGEWGHKTQPHDKPQRHFSPSSAGHSVKQHFSGSQRSYFTLCAPVRGSI